MTSFTVNNEAISASAGSGKTFQLAHRYIKLLAHGIDPERLIALTFSRKAAGEIFEAIVKHLYRAAGSPAEAKKTADRIYLSSMTQQDFLKILKLFLNSLHRLHISTLDSFIISILRAFPFELGIPASLQMLDSKGAESRQLSREVLQTIFLSSRSNEIEGSEFLSAFQDATYGQVGKNLETKLDAFIADYRSFYQQIPSAEYWGDESTIWPGRYPWLISSGDAVSAAVELKRLLRASGLSDMLASSLAKLADFAGAYSESSAWDDKITGSTVFRRLLENYRQLEQGSFILTYMGKDYPLTDRQCRLLLLLLRSIMDTELRTAVKKTQGIYHLLDKYEQTYMAMIRRRGMMTFTDAQLLLTEANHTSSGSIISRTRGAAGKLYIDYRLDCRLDHWLLDEFQDTSNLQWEVLRNLADEILQDYSGQRSLFYVGDVKQAIYSWRGGNAHLFNKILEQYASRISIHPLNTSYRSCGPVIETVNGVFSDLTESSLPEKTVRKWNDIWQTHYCSDNLAQTSGFCAVIEPDCQNGTVKPAKEDRYAIVASLLREIDPVSKEMSAAILVRSNEAGRDIADYLRCACPGMDVIHEGRSAVKDNMVAALLLALVQYAAHPGDTLAWRHIQMSPLINYFSSYPDRYSVSIHLLGEIQTFGYQAFIRSWGNKLHKNSQLDEYGLNKFNALIIAAGEFDGKGGRECNEFIEFIESYETLDSTADKGIRIMTIHQSKGLGFDIVILPDLNLREAMTSSRPDFLTAKIPLTDVPLWTLKMPRRIVAEHDPVLSMQVKDEDEKACFDELCILYVALTRARRGLYMITSYPGKTSSILNHAAFLKLQLAKDMKPVNGQHITIDDKDFICLYRKGQQHWFYGIPEKAVQRTRARAMLPEKFGISRDEVRPSSIIPSTIGEGEIPAGKLFAREHRNSIEIGKAVHQLFEKVLWVDDLDLEKHVQDWRKSTVLEQNMADRAAEQFHHALKSPEIRMALSRPQETAIVWNERSFEVVLDNRWISGTFDRVMIKKCGDAILNAVIIDYKTNELGETETAIAAERYRPQIMLYRKSLARILSVNESLISTRLVFTMAGRVIDL